MKVHARIEQYLRAYERAIDAYEKEHPHWRIEVLVSLIKWSLKSLKHYIEDVCDSAVTWKSPLVELHYPVEWNWKPRGNSDVAPGGHVFGKITKENTATKEIATKTLGEIMTRQFNAMALADATNWAWYEKLKNYYIPVLPVQLSVELDAIKGKRQRRECFDELVRPYSIGATRIDAGILKLKSGKRVPKKLLKSESQMDISSFRFTGDVNGRKIDMGLIFEIHPLIADYDQKKAYHPIVVGLAVLNGNARIVDGELVQDTPADWPKADRKIFWEELLAEIEKLTGKLIPKTEAQDSVILSVNSQIKVPASCWHPEHRSATIKQIADLQSAAGELQDLRVHAADSGTPQLTQPACLVCGWMHDAEFTQMAQDGAAAISLSGVLPDIVRVVHKAHERGFERLSTKDGELLRLCGGYRHPCMAFGDLKRSADYKRLFDTSRHGFVSLRGAVGIIRNQSESDSE
jgi:hypothetical protein